MAQQSYEEHAALVAARTANAANGAARTNSHFMGEYLAKDGDVAIVRFPYHSMSDITYETTHTVDWPGSKYGKRVRCVGTDCPLCKAGVKVDSRFFAKMVVYVADAQGNITLVPTVWDRSSQFADIDIKNLMEEYGDLTDFLFKIKRNGAGKDTRYTISVVVNKTVYNPDVYVKDFTCLEGINPVNVLSRSYEQYQKALNPETATTTVKEEVRTVAPTAPADTAPAAPAATATPVTPVTPADPTPAAEPAKPVRYQF